MNRKIYRKIAKRHGISVKEVKRDMQVAIDEAYKNPNSYAQSINFKGDKPTIDEVVNHVIQKAKKNESDA